MEKNVRIHTFPRSKAVPSEETERERERKEGRRGDACYSLFHVLWAILGENPVATRRPPAHLCRFGCAVCSCGDKTKRESSLCMSFTSARKDRPSFSQARLAPSLRASLMSVSLSLPQGQVSFRVKHISVPLSPRPIDSPLWSKAIAKPQYLNSRRLEAFTPVSPRGLRSVSAPLLSRFSRLVPGGMAAGLMVSCALVAARGRASERGWARAAASPLRPSRGRTTTTRRRTGERRGADADADALACAPSRRRGGIQPHKRAFSHARPADGLSTCAPTDDSDAGPSGLLVSFSRFSAPLLRMKQEPAPPRGRGENSQG